MPASEEYQGYPLESANGNHQTSAPQYSINFRTTQPGHNSEPSPPPDGGAQAWAQVLVGHLVSALTWGYSSSFGVFQVYYESKLPNSPSEISWIGGFQVFCLLFISTLSGRAADAGFAQAVILAGAIFILIGTFMVSLSTKYWQIFLAHGLCIGLGQGLMWLPSVTLISTYFVQKRVFAITAASTGTSTGGAIFPVIMRQLVPMIGFSWAIRCIGFIALVMAIIIRFFSRTRLPPRTSGPLVEWGALKESSFMLFTLGIFLLYWSLYFAFFYIQVYAIEELGVSESAGVYLIIVINGVGILVRMPFGYLADRYLGPLNCLILWVAICATQMYAWAAVDNLAGLYTFAVVYGIASSAAMGLFVGSLPSLTNDMSKMGTRMGMMLTMVSVGPLTGPSVAGAFIARTDGSYNAAQIWAGTSLSVGLVALISARLITSGWNLRVKL